jgi:nucleotide-binding universal stress UspA family protein
MPNGRKLNRFHARRFSDRELHFHAPQCVAEPRYHHIVLATSLSAGDRTALLLGFELALVHQSMLTLLHVLPHARRDRIAQGLDAIGLLHAAADELRGPTSRGSEAARPRLRKFVEDQVPRRLLDAVRWRGDCRGGDVSETVIAYSNETDADLVILPAKPRRWWLPLAGLTDWTIERRTRAHVIVVRGPATSRLS